MDMQDGWPRWNGGGLLNVVVTEPSSLLVSVMHPMDIQNEKERGVGCPLSPLVVVRWGGMFSEK